MLNKIFQNRIRFLSAIAFVFLLGLVRLLEQHLFYDPFLSYFKDNFNTMPLPAFNSFHLFVSYLFRFGLNMSLSLGLLYVLFKEIELVKFVVFLYLFLFIVLILVFFSVLYFYENQNNLLLFYVRRFLIQPIFIILLIPAFYYQKQNK